MNKRYWNTWFAWYPVAFGPHIAWFKVIQRKWIDSSGADKGYWLYRRNKYVI